MKLLRRNLTEFAYRAYAGKREAMEGEKGERHTGQWNPSYADPVKYRGNISTPNGFTQSQFFGINPDYTHVLLTDDPDMDIKEDGLIDWKGSTYEIKAVRPSLNVLSVALKRVTDAGKNWTPPNGAGDAP